VSEAAQAPEYSLFHYKACRHRRQKLTAHRQDSAKHHGTFLYPNQPLSELRRNTHYFIIKLAGTAAKIYRRTDKIRQNITELSLATAL
jgi:hypothetical protein